MGRAQCAHTADPCNKVPERQKKGRWPDQPYWREARDALETAALGKEVRVQDRGRDKYDRMLVWLTMNLPPPPVSGARGSSLTLNTMLLASGLAWVYPLCDRDADLLKLQDEAQAAKRGLWADAQPTPPWLWRKGQGR